MAEKQHGMPERRPAPVTDSPWFWLMIFGVAGLAALIAIAPKHARRQARLERMNATRDQIARQMAEGDPGVAVDAEVAEQAEPGAPLKEQPAGGTEPADEVLDVRDVERRHSLEPLTMVLSLALAGVALAIGVMNHLRRASRRQEAAPGRDSP